MAHLCPGNVLNLKLKAVGFAEDIADCRSLAIVGLEKNTGKTECLNYILSRIGGQSDRFALTSIGVDGESLDQVCRTPKPEIEVPSGMLFVTSEKHFREKRLVAEILEMSEERTALGRLVTARAKSTGKVLLSGPADTAALKRLIGRLKDLGGGDDDCGRSGVPVEFGFSRSHRCDDFGDGSFGIGAYSRVGP